MEKETILSLPRDYLKKKKTLPEPDSVSTEANGKNNNALIGSWSFPLLLFVFLLFGYSSAYLRETLQGQRKYSNGQLEWHRVLKLFILKWPAMLSFASFKNKDTRFKEEFKY